MFFWLMDLLKKDDYDINAESTLGSYLGLATKFGEVGIGWTNKEMQQIFVDLEYTVICISKVTALVFWLTIL